MLKTKIFQVYKAFDGKEIKRFENFVKADHINTGRDFSTLLKSLRETVKNGFFDESEDECFRFISSKTKLKKTTLHSRLSELYTISEDFNLLLYFNKYTIQKKLYMLESYLETKNYKLFNYAFNLLLKKLDKSKVNQNTLKNYSELYSKASTKSFYEGNFKDYDKFNKLSEELEFAYFVVQMLLGIIESSNKKKYRGRGEISRHEILDIPNAVEIIFKTKPINSKLQGFIRTLFSFYKLYTEEESKERLNETLQIFRRYRSGINESENYNFFILLINYCIVHINNQVKGYSNELFYIIKEKLDAGYTKDLSQHNIPVNQFKDYVQIALKAGEKNWARNFVNNYSYLLPASIRYNAINDALGMIALYENKTEEALSYYSKITKSNYVDYLDSSIGKVICYFRLGMYLECLEQINSVKSYLKYHKEIPEIFIKINLNTVSAYSLLIKYKDSGFNKTDILYKLNKLMKYSTVYVKQDMAELNISV